MTTDMPLIEPQQQPQECADLLDGEGFPILAGMSPILLNILNKAARIMHISSGVEVIQEGEVASNLYFIHRGSLNIAKHIRGQPKQITSLNAGNLYGEFGVIRNRPRFASVISAEPCQVIRVNKEAIIQVMQVDKLFNERMEALLRERMLDSFFFSHPVFHKLSPRDRGTLGKKLRILSLRSGEKICSHGAPATGVFFILSGKAEIHHVSPTGDEDNEVLLEIRRTNDMVGETTGNGVITLAYSATATSDLDILLIDDDALRFIIERYPETLKALEKDIRERAKNTIKRIQENLDSGN